jgi:hypothetical protein
MIGKLSIPFLHALTEAHVGDNQFGFRKGRSCELQVSNFKARVRTRRRAAAVFVDVRKAYDSTKAEVIQAVLAKVAPDSFLEWTMEQSLRDAPTSFYLASGESPPTMVGGRLPQGDPRSCALFNLVYEVVTRVAIRRFVAQGLDIDLFAFADDMTLLCDPSHMQPALDIVQQVLREVGLEANAAKTSSMLFDMDNVHANERLLATLDGRPVLQRRVLKYLGIWIRSDLSSTADLVLGEAQVRINGYATKPIPPRERILLWNRSILPLIQYRLATEATPISFDKAVDSMVKKFVLAVAGLPTCLAHRSFFSAQGGLGVVSAAGRTATRFIDTTRKALAIPTHAIHAGADNLVEYVATVRRLGGRTAVSRIQPVLPFFAHLPYIPELVTQLGSHPYRWQSGDVGTDGSYIPDGAAGAAAVLGSGASLMARSPGVQNSYRGELTGIILGARLAPDRGILHVDCKGAIAVCAGTKPTYKHLDLVHEARAAVLAKDLTIRWTKGHANFVPNLAADYAADRARALPLPLPSYPHAERDLVWQGRPLLGTAKEMAESASHQHHHTGVHPISWRPLRKNPVYFTAKVQWYFGGVSRPGFAFPSNEWYEHRRVECARCNGTHGTSVHRILAECPISELHLAYCKAWGSEWPLVKTWWDAASLQDRFLAARLLIPASLFAHLNDELGRRTFGAIKRFHTRFPTVHKALADQIPPLEPRPFKRQRPSTFGMEKRYRQPQPGHVPLAGPPASGPVTNS